jgi:hypothetical protein
MPSLLPTTKHPNIDRIPSSSPIAPLTTTSIYSFTAKTESTTKFISYAAAVKGTNMTRPTVPTNVPNVHPDPTTQAQPSQPAQGNRQGKCRATQTHPDKRRLTPIVAIDLEFQNFKHRDAEKERHRVGRVAIVNQNGDTVLDVYAAYPNEEGVAKIMPPARFMVQHKDLQFKNGAVPAHKVERWVKELLKDRTVVLHGGQHDLTAFTIERDVYAKSRVKDTQVINSGLQGKRTPSLRDTVNEVLQEDVQEDGYHSAVEDAQFAMKLYLKHIGKTDGKLFRTKKKAPAILAQNATQASTSTTNRPYVPGVYYTMGGAILDV